MDKKLHILIRSAREADNRRTVIRNTYLKELPENCSYHFVTPGETAIKGQNDVLVITDTFYKDLTITPDIVTIICSIAHINAEWILVLDDISYVWIDRLLPYLTTMRDFVGVDHETSPIYAVRTSTIPRVNSELSSVEIGEAMKKSGKKLFTPDNFIHPVKVPKTKNDIIALAGVRPDKIERIHERRSKPHVAIVTISLGKYNRFFGGWYESIQEYFLTTCTRHYYVFTDAEELPYMDCLYCTKIDQENLGWPGNTLHRFSMFMKLKEELQQYDYIYFVQVTGRLWTYLNESDVIPDKGHYPLTVFRNIDMPDYLSYDPQPNSTAFIDKNKEGKIYAQGGAFGGPPETFFELSDFCIKNIAINKENGVPEWLNDESHLNKFILNKHPKEAWLRFWWPPTDSQRKKCKLYTLEKKRYGGFNYLRTQD